MNATQKEIKIKDVDVKIYYIYNIRTPCYHPRSREQKHQEVEGAFLSYGLWQKLWFNFIS